MRLAALLATASWLVAAPAVQAGDSVDVDLLDPATTPLRSGPARLDPGEALEIVLRAPAPAPAPTRVRFETEPAEAAAKVALTIRADGREAEALAHEQDGAGRVAALPARGAGGAILLRFENGSAGAVRISAATLSSPAAPHAALLPEALRPPDGRRFNVLVYVVDTLRRDRMSLYGYPSPTTPRLESFAERSLVFEEAYAPGAHTIPSISALFASAYPSRLGGRIDSRERVPMTLAERFQSAGYDTLALQANYMVRPSLGYERGFDDYRIFVDRSEGSRRSMPAEALREAALGWLGDAARGRRPFFLYVQSMDVHDYRPPEPFASQFRGKGFQGPWIDDATRAATPADSMLRTALDRYDATIAYADHEIGRLLDAIAALGLADSTVVVITSDHGEPLGQRGEIAHGRSLYEELVHVPLIVHLPWAARPARIDGVTSLVDLAPFLADLAGLAIPEAWVGHSPLRPYAGVEVPTAMGTRGAARWLKKKELPHSWYLRRGRWKLVLEEPDARLFDLSNDPLESRDVSALHPVTTRALSAEVRRRSPAFRAGWTEPAVLEEGMSEKERLEFEAELRSLGYIE